MSYDSVLGRGAGARGRGCGGAEGFHNGKTRDMINLSGSGYHLRGSIRLNCWSVGPKVRLHEVA